MYFCLFSHQFLPPFFLLKIILHFSKYPTFSLNSFIPSFLTTSPYHSLFNMFLVCLCIVIINRSIILWKNHVNCTFSNSLSPHILFYSFSSLNIICSFINIHYYSFTIHARYQYFLAGYCPLLHTKALDISYSAI